jgi:hypothetical protein
MPLAVILLRLKHLNVPDLGACPSRPATEKDRNRHCARGSGRVPRPMNVHKIRAGDMARKIRDRHPRRLAGKTPDEVIAFYRVAGQAAVEDAPGAGERERRLDAR